MSTFKILIFASTFLATVSCGKKSFETEQPSVEEPPIIEPTGEECPRYDLIVVATDQRQAHRIISLFIIQK